MDHTNGSLYIHNLASDFKQDLDRIVHLTVHFITQFTTRLTFEESNSVGLITSFLKFKNNARTTNPFYF